MWDTGSWGTPDFMSRLRDDPAKDGVFAKIDATGLRDRHFQVAEGAALRLQRIALLNGTVEELAESTGSSATFGGGAIYNQGLLTLRRVAVVGNAPRSGDRFSFQTRGGGIANEGTLIAEDTLLALNRIPSGVPHGGALATNGDASLSRTLMTRNYARRGSAISVLGPGILRLENVTIDDNSEFVTASGGSLSRVENVIQAQVLNRTGAPALHPDVRAFFVTIAGNRHVGSGTSTFDLIDNLSSTRPVVLANSLIVANDGRTCSGRILSLGGNVLERPCPVEGNPPLADLAVGVEDPTSRRYRGGFTPVLEIGAATGRARVPPAPAFDQRGSGFARALDAAGNGPGDPDSGAFEFSRRLFGLTAGDPPNDG